MSVFPRVMGVLTAAYGVSVLARPDLLAKPSGRTEADGTVSEGVAVVTRALAARDAASGLAMVFAPAGPALRTAIAVRVGSDISDAVLLGLALPDKDKRRKVVAVALLWGALCAASALTT